MAIKFTLDFNDGSGARDVTNLVRRDSVQRYRGAWSKLKPTNNTLQYQLEWDSTINNLLMTTTADIDAVMSSSEFIDRGDCEDAIPPCLFDEIAGTAELAITYARSSAVHSGNGSYSGLITKGAAVGTYVAWHFTDNRRIDDLHGLTPGDTYTFTLKLYVPTTGGIGTVANARLYLGDYQGAWQWTTQAAAGAKDTWLTVSVTRTIRAAATGVGVAILLEAVEAATAFVYVDDISLTVSTAGTYRPLFTGLVRPNFRYDVNSRVAGTRIECVDNGYRVRKQIMSNISWAGYAVCTPAATATSIVHALMTGAGRATDVASDIPAISTTVANYVKIKGTQSYWDALSEILFDYGYVPYWREDGKLTLQTFAPASVATAIDFDNSNAESPLTIERFAREYENARIKWWQTRSIANAIIFSDTTGGNALHKCEIPVTTGDSYPPESESKDVYIDYRYFDGSREYELVAVTGAALQLLGDADIHQDTFTDEILRAKIQIDNGGAGTEYIYKLDGVGTAIVKDTLNITESPNPLNSDKIFEYESKWIAAQGDAETLSDALYRYYLYAGFKYTARSRSVFQIGCFSDVVEANFLSINNRCVIVEARDNPCRTDIPVSYTLEGIAAYSAMTHNTSGTFSPWVTPKRTEIYTLAATGSSCDCDERLDGTNDQTEINAAIVKINAAGGGTVRLAGPGTVTAGAAIALLSNVTLEIMPGVTVTKNGNFNLISCVGTSGSHKRSVAVIGGGTLTQADTNNNALVYCEYVDGVLCQDLTLNLYYDGFYTLSCSNVASDKLILGSAASGAVDGSVAILIDGAATGSGIRITDNVAASAGKVGKGIYAAALAGECTISGNHVIGTNAAGTAIAQIGIACLTPNSVVQGNTVRNLRSSVLAGYAIGIELQGTGSKATGNTVSGMSDSADPGWGQGIRVESCDDTTIQDNTVFDCSGKGIRVVDGSHHHVQNNSEADNGDVIDRGDCESATAPMVDGESVPLLLNATFARSSTQKYEGAYSYQGTKTVAAGTAGTIDIVDNNTTTDLHGLIPGVTYKLQCRIRIPGGAMLGSELTAVLSDYSGGAWADTSQACALTYDAWQTVSVTRAMRATATGIRARFVMAAASENGEGFYIDDIRLIPQGSTNAHDNNIDDDGTDTIIQGNSTMNPQASEPNLGEYHKLNRTASAYDVSAASDQTGSPGTLDLSLLGVPVGAKAVEIWVKAYVAGTSETAAFYGIAWNLDDGAFDAYRDQDRGVMASAAGCPASSGSISREAVNEGKVVIGTSRKLYYGLSAASRTMHVQVKGYYMP